jgi:adenylate kinase family enzyme
MRILIVGTSCAGKSTFARALAAATGLKHVELDQLHWGANWKPKEESEFRRLTAQATAGDHWIVDGNYRVVRDLLWPRATLVIWLNYRFTTVMMRALRRSVRRIVTQEQLWQGNRESFGRSFLSRDSILLWVITTFHRRRRDFEAFRAAVVFPNLTWVEFRRPTDARRYLESLVPADKVVTS